MFKVHKTDNRLNPLTVLAAMTVTIITIMAVFNVTDRKTETSTPNMVVSMSEQAYVNMFVTCYAVGLIQDDVASMELSLVMGGNAPEFDAIHEYIENTKESLHEIVDEYNAIALSFNKHAMNAKQLPRELFVNKKVRCK